MLNIEERRYNFYKMRHVKLPEKCVQLFKKKVYMYSTIRVLTIKITERAILTLFLKFT